MELLLGAKLLDSLNMENGIWNDENWSFNTENGKILTWIIECENPIAMELQCKAIE